MPKPTIVLVQVPGPTGAAGTPRSPSCRSRGSRVLTPPDVIEVDGSHVSMVSQPQTTIDAILAAVASVSD